MAGVSIAACESFLRMASVSCVIVLFCVAAPLHGMSPMDEVGARIQITDPSDDPANMRVLSRQLPSKCSRGESFDFECRVLVDQMIGAGAGLQERVRLKRLSGHQSRSTREAELPAPIGEMGHAPTSTGGAGTSSQ
jgi:hypothetical protein